MKSYHTKTRLKLTNTCLITCFSLLIWEPCLRLLRDQIKNQLYMFDFKILFPGKELDNVRLICYYQISTLTRGAPMNLSPKSLDPYLCTHIIYYQAKLDDSNSKIISGFPHLDLDQGSLFVTRAVWHRIVIK